MSESIVRKYCPQVSYSTDHTFYWRDPVQSSVRDGTQVLPPGGIIGLKANQSGETSGDEGDGEQTILLVPSLDRDVLEGEDSRPTDSPYPSDHWDATAALRQFEGEHPGGVGAR